MHKLFFLLPLLLLPFFIKAQKTITLDPEKDPIARCQPDGSLQATVPVQALLASFQASIPETTFDVESFGFIKMGKSNYLIARGERRDTPMHTVVAFLLTESTPHEFHTDGLLLTCSGSGECRECSLPATCNCLKGAGSCTLSASVSVKLQKVSVTLPN
jgi:hypothetical protein